MAIANLESVEAPARQILERGRKTFERIVQHAGKRDLTPLQASPNEAAFLIEAARLAIVSFSSPADRLERGLQQARLRGLARLVELRKAAEPCLETGAVCELLGVSRETVRKKVQRKQLLALPKGNADKVFPAFQFDKGGVLPGMKEVLQALDAGSPFMALSFFLSRSPAFGKKSMVEALRSGLVEEVVAEASNLLKHGS